MLSDTTFLLLIKLSLKFKFSIESSPTQVEKAKPNPEIFQLAFDKFGFGADDVLPEEVLVLEDSPLGVRDHPHMTSTLCSPPLRTDSNISYFIFFWSNTQLSMHGSYAPSTGPASPQG